MLREESDSAELTGPTVFKDERKQAYLNPEGADRPLISPLPATTLDRARRYRLERLRAKMREWDCGALLLYDPVNIRYAFDSSNMSIWTMHNASRYALILADGPAILFEFEGAEHVNDGLPGIDEIRPAKSWIFFTAGNLMEPRLKAWVEEVADLIKSNGGNKRVAVDKLEPAGAFELRERGFMLLDGQELAERARSIKSADEIELMRWTIRVCEAGMSRMYEVSEPGRTEREIWAELHFENARSGGEWLETKLLSAGPRTNPWYQECSDYVIKRGEMISFDTDMIGPYGYCADLSRSWTAGHVAMNAKQKELYDAARGQIEHNLAILKPGMTFAEFNALSWRIPEKYQPYRYTLALHGTGMADEWPGILLHPDFDPDFSGLIKEGMVLNVESLIAEAGSESIKLETQALITATGAERLDTFPWEDI
ncbi:M24 family metallopeptidase (plasmid) [Rhizobium leguminosarum]